MRRSLCISFDVINFNTSTDAFLLVSSIYLLTATLYELITDPDIPKFPQGNGEAVYNEV